MVSRNQPVSTTIVPLNFALRAKATALRIFWTFVTIVDALIVVYLIVLLVMKYQNNDTKVMTQVSTVCTLPFLEYRCKMVSIFAVIFKGKKKPIEVSSSYVLQ